MSFLFFTAAILIGGCATTSQRSADARRPNVNLSGYSASFRQGYVDGCDSVRKGQPRDAKRAGGDTDYVMGWNDGYSICARRQ